MQTPSLDVSNLPGRNGFFLFPNLGRPDETSMSSYIAVGYIVVESLPGHLPQQFTGAILNPKSGRHVTLRGSYNTVIHKAHKAYFGSQYPKV